MIFKVFVIFFGSVVFLTFAINVWIVLVSHRHIYTSPEDISPRTAVLVLGAQVIGTTLSPVLEDRVSGGIQLMESGKGEKLLLSGDHREKHYNEVRAMKLFVLDNAPSIPHEDIFLDHSGISTWDSMFRAKNIFEVSDLIIVTQKFHINRAVAMARSLGMDAAGFAVNQGHFSRRTLLFWHFREYFARVRAFYSILFRPNPHFLGDVTPISGDGRYSWY
ncbi:MAG: YdcF family protein [Treponema sp.]|jgi:vancomycin permeability regulator SanA|nr:YdcF family protein [Treponema sp.]